MPLPEKLRPNLAPTDPVDPRNVPISKDNPYYLSPKLDGFRFMAVDCCARSRVFKEPPNLCVKEWFSRKELDGLDGEVVVGPPTHPLCITATTSGVNSIKGEPDFKYYIFDRWDMPDSPFVARRIAARRRYESLMRIPEVAERLVLIPQYLVTSPEEAETRVAEFYDAGYEGGMLRRAQSLYRYGRSTEKQADLFKVKESIDFEVQITGFVEMRHNQNEAVTNGIGLTERATKKESMVAAGTLGTLLGIDTRNGEPVKVSTGKMTAPEKQYVWDHQEKFLSAYAKCRAGKHGTKDRPRFPRFITWRPGWDFKD